MTTDLNSLLIFAQVVESSSFSKAALRLSVPISTVSRRVSELERQLGVRLIERSTRHLRLTQVGSEVFAQAQRSSEINSAVINIASHHGTTASGVLRVSVPPTLSSGVASVACRFQELYQNTRVQILITERVVSQIEEGIDLAFREGPLDDSSLVVRHLPYYRHRLLASPEYLSGRDLPISPTDLLHHRLISFASSNPESTWSFSRDGSETESVTFQPQLSMNDYSELAFTLLAGGGIGELPPTVRPELLRQELLVEVMPLWRFPALKISVIHVGGRLVPRLVQLFKELAAEMIPKLFSAPPE